LPGGASPTYAITAREVAEGSYVMPGNAVFNLVIESPLKFRGRVPERKSSEVRVGQKADIKVSAYPQPFPGEITRINPAVDPETRTFEVEILVPNDQSELKPGGFAKTAIYTAVDEEAPTVPLTALVHSAGVTKIFLVEDGHAKEVQVVPGVQGTDWVEIAEPDLPRGAEVITSGQTAIADRTAVAVRSGPWGADSDKPESVGQEGSQPAAPPMARREIAP
jgi:RND family efflux transporter MFP subunit